jgi:hypothetical protein
MGSWDTRVGLSNVGSYQVSGKPFASGSISAPVATAIDFPEVARWFQITNRGNTPVKVGFSELGVNGDNHFVLDASSSAGYGVSQVFELKVSQIWVSGSSAVDVVAGLTNINIISAETATGPNWSGSSGVG